MMEPDRMLRARTWYTDRLGLAQTPLRGKRPVLPDWQTRRLSPEELDRYVREGHGIGCVHGTSGTATLDADAPEELVARALGAVGVDYAALLDSPGPKTIGNAEKPPKPWYLVPEGYDLARRVLNWPKEGDPSGREVILELRAGPVQDVLPPSDHPDTGNPYRWTDIPGSREDLPLIPSPLLGLWLAWDALRPAMEAACPWAAPAEPMPTPPRTRSDFPHQGESIIEAWNERIPAGVVLERNGYRRTKAGRWTCPDSTTGDPGVVLLDGRVFSHHGSDPLAGPHSHDSFSVLAVLEHGGDAREAARSAARELGLDAPGRAARARAALTGTAS